MTTQELISVHLGDGATPDEEALLSRALVSDPAVCREFVAAARMEGALHAQALGPDDRAELGATLEAAGIACPSAPTSRSPVLNARSKTLATAACLLLAAGAWIGWSRRPGVQGIGAHGAADRRPPPTMTLPASSHSPVPTSSTPSRRDALAARAAQFYLPKLECADQPLDALIEYVLGEVAAANHRERAELSGFELAWQPLDVASASSPPRVTLRQTHVSLDTALEWIGLLTNCTVQWHERGARLVESLPEPDSGPTTLRTLDLARFPAMPPRSDAGEPPPAAAPTAADILESIGLTGPHLRSARLNAGSTLAVDLPETEWERLQRILALRDQAAPPRLSLTARVVEMATPQEIDTQVMEPERYRQLAATLADQTGTATVATPTIHTLPGQTFQIEMAREAPASASGGADWAGLRVTGRTSLSGEVVLVSASVVLRLPDAADADEATPAGDSLDIPAPSAPPLREQTTDLEALIPPGHTLVFAVTEAGDDRCLSLHLSADLGSPSAPGEASTTAGQ